MKTNEGFLSSMSFLAALTLLVLGMVVLMPVTKASLEDAFSPMAAPYAAQLAKHIYPRH